MTIILKILLTVFVFIPTIAYCYYAIFEKRDSIVWKVATVVSTVLTSGAFTVIIWLYR